MVLNNPNNKDTRETRDAQARQQLSLSLRTCLVAIRGAIATALEDEAYRDPSMSRETLLLISGEVDKLWARINEVVSLGDVQAANQKAARPAARVEATTGRPVAAPQPLPQRAPAPALHLPSLAGKRSRIVVVDDEASIQTYLRRSLQEAGYEPLVEGTPRGAMAVIESAAPDLVLLDLHLGPASGFDVLKAIRATSKVPVIMLTVSDSDEDTVKALTLGADDYVTKPFRMEELLARVDAVLRRKLNPDALRVKPDFVLHGLRVNFRDRNAVLDGQPLALTPTEYKLLRELADQAGRVLTFDELLKRVWGPEYAGEAGLVRVQVRNLRRKLGDDGAQPKFIFSQRGIGYKMPRE